MTAHAVQRGFKVLRALLLIAAAGAVAQLVAKKMTTGDETSDDFRLAAIVGGREFTSSATALRSGSALAAVGGIVLDLREAGLDPDGATLDVTTVVGGVEVRVPEGWAVDVESHGMLGGLDNRLSESAHLPANAPALHITTHTWLGGIQIRGDG